MNEDRYIKGLHQGNEKIFREIFEKYQARLCYYASTLLPDAEDAEDVVQESFVKLWQKRTHFDNLNAIKSFLYITVKNRCLNIYRHDKVVKKYADLFSEETTPEGIVSYLIEAEALEKIHQAIQKLPSGCRTVLHLSYFEGLKNKEVAEHLQVSINTVKTQKMRGIQLLRGLLKGASLLLWLLDCFFAGY